MALHGCRECGKPVGSGSDACPHCGATAPWSRKNPRRGNDALWVMGTIIVGLTLLAMFGCSSTESSDSHVPQLGRYEFNTTIAGATYGGILMISAASAESATWSMVDVGVRIFGNNLSVPIERVFTLRIDPIVAPMTLEDYHNAQSDE